MMDKLMIILCYQGIYPIKKQRGMTLAWFEHGRGKGCVRKEFPYIRKLCKDYRLEAKGGGK